MRQELHHNGEYVIVADSSGDNHAIHQKSGNIMIRKEVYK